MSTRPGPPPLTRAIRYEGRKPASTRASKAASGASKKADTRCEVALSGALWRAGCRFRKNAKDLPGRPDLVFTGVRVVVFCDGDFWHGRDWESRALKLRAGANADYWLDKIARNRQRDLDHNRQLEAGGWTVIRLWETEILRDVDAAAGAVLQALDARGHRHRLSRAAQAGTRVDKSPILA